MTTASIADQLKALVELQKLDSEIYAFRRQLQEKPVQLVRLKERQKEFAQKLQATESRYKNLEVKRNQMENDLAQKEGQFKKLQVQLFQLKTNKEYAAMLKEIEGLKADHSVLEEEILKVMEEAEKAKGAMAAERESLKVEENALAAQMKQIEEEGRQIQSSMEQLQSSRGGLTSRVDPPILSQYERILAKTAGLALVPVRGDACGGCNMVLPPQMINEIQMNTRLTLCESCARILFLEG